MSKGPTEIGRLDADEVGKEHVFDSPTKANAAILTKLDEIIDLLIASSGAVVDAAAADLEKIKFKY
jgi:hypothetical protein